MADPIPPRADGALSGAQIEQRLREIMGDTQSGSAQEVEARRARLEEFVIQQVALGNVPDFMRPENFREFSVEVVRGKRTFTARIRVAPDYLSIGGNDDYVRIPLGAISAQQIADRFGLVLPTQRMVDLIDAQATSAGGMMPFVAAPAIAKRVTDPRTGQPVEKRWNYKQYGFYEGRWMISSEFIVTQNQMLRESPREMRTAAMRSGSKKVVIYDPLALKESHEGGPPVVIYLRGIQGLSNWHNENYWDYSHGIRYASPTVQITVTEAGKPTIRETMPMRDVLMHKDYHHLLSPATMDINLMYRGSQRRATPQRTAQPRAAPPPPPPAPRSTVQFGEIEIRRERRVPQTH